MRLLMPLRLFEQGKISAVLVVAPKGVHRQWIEQQIPEHMPEELQLRTEVWKKKELHPSMYQPSEMLKIFAANTDALRTKNGFKICEKFVRGHKRKVLMIVDESHMIKTYNSMRTKAAIKLGECCDYRMILTGTPIAKNLLDEWSQFNFLDPGIIGKSSVWTFKHYYCKMGGYERKEIVGYRNIDEFKNRVSPYSYRITKKDALDLPEQIYQRYSFDLTPSQRKIYDELKQTFLSVLESGEVASAANAAVLVMRLQQITSGFILTEAETLQQLQSAKLEALKEIVQSSTETKILIWSRFTNDIRTIQSLLNEIQIKKKKPPNAVTYSGSNSNKENEAALDSFMNGEARFFIANQAKGGTGLNLQGQCKTVIYYANSFNAIDRWQSEARVHRIGTHDPVQYIDLVAKNTVDIGVLGQP